MNPKATESELSQFSSDRFALSIGQLQFQIFFGTVPNGWKKKTATTQRSEQATTKKLEKALWLWFCNVRSRNLAVWDEMFQEKD